MKTYKYIALAAIALGFAACSQEEDFTPQGNQKGAPITIASVGVANLATRATIEDDKLVEGNIGVTITSTGNDERYTGSNVNWYGSNGVWGLVENQKVVLYEGNGESQKIYAYYPYAKDIIEGTENLPVTLPETFDSNFEGYDYLCTKEGISLSQNPISLTLSHAFSKVSVSVNVMGNELEGDVVTEIALANVPRNGERSATTGAIDPDKYGPANGRIALYGYDDEDYDEVADYYIGYALPNAATTLDLRVTMQSGRIFTAKAPISGGMTDGVHYKIGLNLGKDKAEVGTVTVAPWGTGGTIEGSVAEEVIPASTEAELVAALANGGNIMLTGDITVSDEYWGGYEITKNTTIDLNGHTITGVHVFTPNPENAGVVLTISGNGTIKATDPYSDMPVDVWGTLNLLSGTIEGSTNIFGTINMYGGWVDELNTDKLNSDDDTSHITGGYVRHLNCWGGIVTISGGHVEALGIKYGRIIISGGTFGFDPTAYLAEGYTATEADGKWAVTCANGCEYTYSDNGDGTHGKVCTECGNVVASEPHTLTYTASGNVITATCSANCGYSETATISAENATYNGTEQTTASIAYSEGWTGGEPTVSYENNVNAGTATASITLGEATASVEFTIAKAEINIDDLVNPEFAKGLIYNGTAQALVTAHGSVPGGTILYSLTYDGEYTTTIPVATEAGNYRVYWTIECDENHYVDVTPGSSRVTIAKAASSITTAPSGKELTYKGYAQALVTAGEAMGGTILYSLDNATWNEEIPVGKEIGDYTVYYKVIGDNNHDDIATQSVTVAIKACEHSYNEDGFCEMCSTANPDETMFFIFDGDHKAFNVAEDLVGVNIEYTRGLHNTEWNSIYLPFEVPVTEGLLDEFEFAYVNDMHSADTDDNGEIDEIEMEIVKIKTGTLHANHPYFIRAKSEYTILQLSYENTTLHATEETTLNCSSIYMDYAIVGSYKHIKGTEFASMPADRYYAISIDGGWWQIPEDSSLYPFRAFLSMTARDGSPVKVSDEAMRSIRIREKGEGTTGIEEVKGENGEVKTLYDLQGRKVEVPSKGLYIINGKKVLIK